MHDGTGDQAGALRNEAITLASRIRIALPYRRATAADLAAAEAELLRLRNAGVAEDDDALVELTNLRDTLAILTI